MNKATIILLVTPFLFSCGDLEVSTQYRTDIERCKTCVMVIPDSLKEKAMNELNTCIKNANNMSDEEMEDVIPECRENIYRMYGEPDMYVYRNGECQCCRFAVGEFKQKCIQSGYKYGN
jgi:hypothetical protein